MLKRLHNNARFGCYLFLMSGIMTCTIIWSLSAHANASIDYPVVKLRSLDKITARTQVFEASVGKVVKFGSVYIKVQACRKSSELEKPEAAAFLQVWEIPKGQDAKTTDENNDNDAEWIFSGWMYASSPGLSAMDHPIYDVWVLDCLVNEGDAPIADPKKQESQNESDNKVGVELGPETQQEAQTETVIEEESSPSDEFDPEALLDNALKPSPDPQTQD